MITSLLFMSMDGACIECRSRYLRLGAIAVDGRMFSYKNRYLWSYEFI